MDGSGDISTSPLPKMSIRLHLVYLFLDREKHEKRQTGVFAKFRASFPFEEKALKNRSSSPCEFWFHVISEQNREEWLETQDCVAEPAVVGVQSICLPLGWESVVGGILGGFGCSRNKSGEGLWDRDCCGEVFSSALGF